MFPSNGYRTTGGVAVFFNRRSYTYPSRRTAVFVESMTMSIVPAAPPRVMPSPSVSSDDHLGVVLGLPHLKLRRVPDVRQRHRAGLVLVLLDAQAAVRLPLADLDVERLPNTELNLGHYRASRSA